MAKVKVVIGANFGDEGKGLMTDYFCSKINEPTLNIRFNGTCQAGHTVVKGDKRHVFSHFGSGSFNPNVVTYLSSDFYVNPIWFLKEYEELNNLGVKPVVKIAKNAPVILIYDMIYNRIIENSRGENRHGSCGMGLWEALLRGRKNEIITVEDLQKGVRRLGNQIKDIRDNYFTEKFKNDGLEVSENLSVDDMYWFDDNLIDCYISDAKKMLSYVELVDEYEVFKDYENFVFEGAQGLLLDWMNREYMPYLTASRTGLHNCVNLFKFISNPEIEACYITRSYFTRHGAGLFKTEVEDKSVLGVKENDKTNFQNPWQGQFRYGYFDLDLFKATIQKDLFELYSYDFKKSICVTHLDETNGVIKLRDREMSFDDFKTELGDDWCFYTSYGEDSCQIKV